MKPKFGHNVILRRPVREVDMRNILPVGVLLTILLVTVIFSQAGLAQSVDQLLVVDDAGIFGTRTGDVESACKTLLSQGADIRVRTISTYGSAGNLDRYEAQLEQASPSWIGPDNNLKNNLIVLIISLQERQTGLYYGGYWNDILANNWLRIQTNIMNPLFQNGDFTGGTIKGLEEIQRLIQNKGQTQPASSIAPAQPQQATQTSKGQSNGWIIPVVIVIVVGAIIGLLLFRNRQKDRAKRQAARQKAMLAKQGAASGINELIESMQMLEIKVNATANKIAQEEGLALKDGLEKARILVDRSSQTYSELSHSAGDPENPKLGESELVVIEGEYQKILVNLRQARETMTGVEDQIAVIQQGVEGFPGKVDDANRMIEGALTKQEELKKLGFKTAYLADLLAKGRLTLEQAKTSAAEKRYTAALKTITLAGDQIKQSIQAAEELPQKKQEAETAIPQLAARVEQVKAKVNDGRNVFDRIFKEYADTTWTPVRGNGTEAENRINWSLDALNDARSAAGLEQQDWFNALEHVDKGNQWLTEAETLMKSISDLEVNLIAARRDAPNEIAAAQSDVTKAWDYIKQFDEDIRESLEDDLRTAEKKNDLAREELNREKPDYFNVIKLAREANESADEILIQARSEHEAAERLRAKAISSRRDAGAKVSIARTYIEVHHPAVRSEARNYLTGAIEALRRAEAAPDINEQVSLAAQAESAADQAYSLAQRDVNSTTSNMPNVGFPTIIIPPVARPPGNRPSWGTSRPSTWGSQGTARPGGGSSSWGSRGGGSSSRGGGSTGW